jgi:xanthine dehydrogenase small subunit
MIKFILNNTLVETALPQGSTVLDYIRYHKYLMGTKIGCREGDCGACTILVGDFEKDKLTYRSMTSCLMPIGNAQGKHIVTVEGINGSELTLVQQAMVDTNGTQCGFCTLGFILSFTGFALNETAKKYEDAIAAIDGNICRCTGYKSIERAAQLITEKVKGKPEKGLIKWLVTEGFIPEYFLKIEERLTALQQSIKQAQLQQNGTGDHLILCGGTDLVVQKPLTVKKTNLNFLSNAIDLKGIYYEGGQYVIGAATTVTEFAESPLIAELFPELKKYIKLISSTPIRNMATLAGNFVNASPIGDLTIFFLALNAALVLNKNGIKRTVLLKEFYKGYKQTDKGEGEFIEKILFTQPLYSNLFNFEKVSKRMHLDIASVNTACQLIMTDDTISTIHLSAGGVAPYPKYLNDTVAFLKNKKITSTVLKAALQVMDAEIAPISDARGTAAYKRLLLHQLVLAHFLKFFGPVESIKNVVLHAD